MTAGAGMVVKCKLMWMFPAIYDTPKSLSGIYGTEEAKAETMAAGSKVGNGFRSAVNWGSGSPRRTPEVVFVEDRLIEGTRGFVATNQLMTSSG